MLQTLFNGLISGVIMTLPALAVTLLFGVLRFPNFAVGAMMTVAAYAAFALNAQLGWPLGAYVGALVIGVVSELSTLVMPPNYRIGVPLLAIALVLIFRPQGLFGQPY